MSIQKPISEIIKDLTADIPGWTPEDQLFAIHLLIISTSHLKGDIWEIGSWCGRSSVVIAHASKMSGSNKVHCIDLFPNRDDWFRNNDGSYSFNVEVGKEKFSAYTEQTVWEEPFIKQIVPIYEKYGDSTRDIFEMFIDKKGFKDDVITFKGIANEYVNIFTGDLRVAFLDGDHSYNAVSKDILNVEKFLLPDGWIIFDDAFSSYTGVNEAIEEHIIKSGKYELFQQLTRKCFAAKRK